MNDEIKEILDYISDRIIPNEKWNKVRDYITNLQQENERLKEKSINEVLKNDFNMCVKDLKKANKKIEKLEDYKSRCEKAVEIAKDLKQFVYDELVDRNVSGATEIHSKIIDLLNILNSRSDE